MVRQRLAIAVGVAFGVIMAVTAHAVPVPFSDGSIFSETFAGNAFDESGSAFSGTDVSFSGSNSVRFSNASSSADGTYDASGFTLNPNDEFVAELVFSHNAALADLNGDGTGITRGMLFRAFNATTSTFVDFNLAVRDNPDSTWDISVITAGDGDGGVPVGLSLARNQFHTIAIHHRANPANEVDLYVNGALAGTYIDRSPSDALGYVQVGNPSGAIGFTDSYLDSFSIGLPIPEPASLGLLVLGAYVLCGCRRRAG